MVNSVYMIDIFHDTFSSHANLWNYRLILQDHLYKYILKSGYYELNNIDELFFGEFTQLLPIVTLKQLLFTSNKKLDNSKSVWSLYDHLEYIRSKLLL